MAPLRELRELREHERESPEKSCIKLEENYDFKISKSRYKVLIEESNKVRRNQMLVYQQIKENKGTYVAFYSRSSLGPRPKLSTQSRERALRLLNA